MTTRKKIASESSTIFAPIVWTPVSAIAKKIGINFRPGQRFVPTSWEAVQKLLSFNYFSHPGLEFQNVRTNHDGSEPASASWPSPIRSFSRFFRKLVSWCSAIVSQECFALDSCSMCFGVKVIVDFWGSTALFSKYDYSRCNANFLLFPAKM